MAGGGDIILAATEGELRMNGCNPSVQKGWGRTFSLFPTLVPLWCLNVRRLGTENTTNALKTSLICFYQDPHHVYTLFNPIYWIYLLAKYKYYDCTVRL